MNPSASLRKTFHVGMDSYCLAPLAMSQLEILEWVRRAGGDGVQFSEGSAGRGKPDRAFLSDLSRRAGEAGLYLEWGGGQHLPFDTATWKPKDIQPVLRAAAEEAALLGARCVRSCSGGLMRWTDDAPATEELLRAAAGALKEAMPLLQDLGVVLALELHFEFTTFELLRLFEMCGAQPGGPLGICLDTMNLLTMLEDPLRASDRILPWVVSTHMKDGALIFGERGLVSFPAPLGEGLIDFPSILERLAALDRPVHLSVESHGGSFELPVFEPWFLPRFPDLSTVELAALFSLAREGERLRGEGRLAPLPREAWPGLCEERTARDLKRLKRIAAAPDAGGKDHA